MEPFESRFYLLRFALALLLTLLKITVGVVGISATRLNKYLSEYLPKLAQVVHSGKRKYGHQAILIAFAAVIVTDITWVSLGEPANVFLWNQVPFLLLYWSVVTIISVPVGIVLGLFEVAIDHKRNHR